MSIIELTDVVENEIATVTKQGFLTSKKDGRSWFIVDFVFDNIRSTAGEQLKISKMWDLEDVAAFGYMIKALDIMGWNGKNIFDLDPTALNHHSLIGKKVSLVTHAHNGKIYIKYINDPNYSPNSGIDVVKKQELEDKLKTQLAVLRSEQKSKEAIPF